MTGVEFCEGGVPTQLYATAYIAIDVANELGVYDIAGDPVFVNVFETVSGEVTVFILTNVVSLAATLPPT